MEYQDWRWIFFVNIHAGILGLIANAIVFVVVSLLTSPSPEPVVRAFTRPE